MDVSHSDSAYFDLLARCWSEGRAFVVIEHDIEIARGTLASLKRCDCLWASAGYHGPGYGLPGACRCPADCDSMIHALGCTRFSAEIIRAVPDLFSEVAQRPEQRSWRSLDGRILTALRARGFDYHPHVPVLQHHRFRGVCSCGKDHPYFEVDAEGRYVPA